MSDLKLYRAKLKSRKQIMAEIPREQQGWWADVCAGKTLELRDATEADLERCSLNRDAPRDPAEYLCENIERGSLVRRIAVAELTEIKPRGLVAQHNEIHALRARIKELEAELSRRTQPEATAPTHKDHEIAAVVNDLLDIAVKFHDAQQLRERIAHVVVPLLKSSPADALSARDRVDDLQEIATKLRRAGADIPAPQHDDAIKGATINGLSIALLLVYEAILQSQKDGHG